jgi:hypothetical protein
MTKEVSYTVMVPQEKEETYTVCSYECVPEEKTQTYTVCVPHQVTKQVPVKVCKMVAVEVSADSCGSCGDASGCDSCESGCNTGCRRRRCRRGC